MSGRDQLFGIGAFVAFEAGFERIRRLGEHTGIAGKLAVARAPGATPDRFRLADHSSLRCCGVGLFSSRCDRRISLALDSIEKFFWQTFCDNYLELVKDQLFNPGKYAADEVAATRWTLATMGMRILQWYAPYIPFVTETLYQQLYKNSGKAVSLHSTHFNQWQTEYDFPASVITMNIVLAIITQVRRLKTEKQLSLKTPLHRLTINAPNVLNLMPIKNQEQLLRGVSQAQEIIITQTDDHTMALQGDAEHWSATIYIDYIAS